jgi:predicted dehydrogenase
MGTIEATTCAYPGFLKKIEICGSRGSIVMEEENITTWQFDEERPGDEGIRQKYGKSGEGSGGGASDPSSIDYRNHKYLFEAFVEAVQQDKPFEIDGKEGRKPIEIIEGIYQSAKTGGPVKLPV